MRSLAVETSERVREILAHAEDEAARRLEAAGPEARREEARAIADARERIAERAALLASLRRDVAEGSAAAERGLRRLAEDLAAGAEELIGAAARIAQTPERGGE